MKSLLTISLNRLVSPRLALLTAAFLMAPCAANATPYVVKLVQQGSNVVATGSGAFDLSALGTCTAGSGASNEVGPTGPNVFVGFTGSTSNGELCPGLAGPSSFGTGSPSYSSVGNGNPVGIDNARYLFVPSGYVSGTALASSATWKNASISTLGVTPGTYVWKWGAGTGEQTFTLFIDNAVSVPAPAELGMFGLGVLLIGGFVTLRRREQR